MATDIQNNPISFRDIVDMKNASSVLYKPDSINENHASPTANFPASILTHRHKPSSHFGLEIDGTVAAYEEIVFVADHDCTIQSFHAKLNGANSTGGTASFDLKKNGTTVLSSTVDITNSEGTNVQDGTLSTTTLAQGDVLSMQLSITTGTDGTGPLAWAVVDEDPT